MIWCFKGFTRLQTCMIAPCIAAIWNWDFILVSQVRSLLWGRDIWLSFYNACTEFYEIRSTAKCPIVLPFCPMFANVACSLSGSMGYHCKIALNKSASSLLRTAERLQSHTASGTSCITKSKMTLRCMSEVSGPSLKALIYSAYPSVGISEVWSPTSLNSKLKFIIPNLTHIADTSSRTAPSLFVEKALKLCKTGWRKRQRRLGLKFWAFIAAFCGYAFLTILCFNRS